MRNLNERAKRIWTKIVVLFDGLEQFKERYPEPRTKKNTEIIKLLESQIIKETKKLKELND